MTSTSTAHPLAPVVAAEPTWSLAVSDHVTALDVSSDGRRVVAGSSAGETAILDAGDGTVVGRLPDHPLGTLCVAFSPDATRVASGGADGVVTVASADAQVLGAVTGSGWANAVSWRPVREQVLAAAIGRSVTLVDPEGFARVSYDAPPSTVTALSWAPNGRRLAAASYGGVRFYDPERTGVVRELAWKGSLLTIAHSPDGKWLVSGNQDSSVHLWRLAGTGELEMAGYPAKINRLAFDRDGRWLAVGGVGDVTLWDMRGKGPGGRRPVVLDGHRQRISALSWRPDGALVASGSPDGSVVLWDPVRPAAPRKVIEVAEPVSTLAWVPTTTSLIVGTASGALALYDTERAA